MELYAELDLHSRNIYIGIMGKIFNRVLKKVPNHILIYTFLIYLQNYTLMKILERDITRRCEGECLDCARQCEKKR